MAGRVCVQTILHQNKKVWFNLCLLLFWRVLFCSKPKVNSFSPSCSALVSTYGLNNVCQETGSPKMRENFILRDFCGSNFFFKGVLFPVKTRPCFFLDKSQFLWCFKWRKQCVGQPFLFFLDLVALKSIINGEYKNCSFHLPSHLFSGFNYTGKLSGIKHLAADILQELPPVDTLILVEASPFFLIFCILFLPLPH